jgi:hypothetical protein
VTSALVCPAISELALFKTPDTADVPAQTK